MVWPTAMLRMAYFWYLEEMSSGEEKVCVKPSTNTPVYLSEQVF